MRQAFTLGAVLLLPSIFVPAALAAPHTAAVVTIISTGDRVTPGYRVTVSPNGALTSLLVPRGRRRPVRQTDQMIPVNRQRFFADLATASPLSRVPTEPLSSTPQIFVRYRGRLSSNLRAAKSTSGQALYQDIKQILQVLRLPIPDVP